MSIRAKLRGKGNQMVHHYFSSIRYPDAMHRVCDPQGRLYPAGMLRLHPVGQPYGWDRECQDCLKVEAEWASNPLLGAI